MDEAIKVDLLIVKRYLQQAQYAAKDLEYAGIKNSIKGAIHTVNETIRLGQ